MNHKDSIISALFLFSINLFLFVVAEFSIFPDIAIIDFPENLVKGEALQNVIFSFIIIFYLSYLFFKASIKKEVQLAQKSYELQDMNARLEESQNEIEQQRESLIELNTELNTYIDQISEKNKALNISNKTKDKLFNIISHDLKSPLSSLVGITEILNKRITQNELDDLNPISNALNTSANRLLTLVLGLLDWSRTQTDSIKPNIKQVQLYEILNSIKHLYENSLNEKNIKLEIICIPDIHIKADYNMFETVVRNLINNAIKFTNQNGQILIEAIESTNEINLHISDNGVGMSPEKINNLSKFHETNSTYGTNNEAGTGLGLLVCYEFLKLHNFSLSVKSKEGKGSTFTILIPVQ